MKPVFKNGFVHSLTLFIPEEYSAEQWDALPKEVRQKEADWVSARFDPLQIGFYHRSPYDHATRIVFSNGVERTVSGDIEHYDKIYSEIYMD